MTELDVLEKKLALVKQEFNRLGEERSILNNELEKLETQVNQLVDSLYTDWANVPIGTRIRVKNKKGNKWDDTVYRLGAYIPGFKRPFITFVEGELPEQARALTSFTHATLCLPNDFNKYCKPVVDEKYNFRVDDEVYCEKFGIGIITRVDTSLPYDIMATFVAPAAVRSFYLNGWYTNNRDDEANAYRIRRVAFK